MKNKYILTKTHSTIESLEVNFAVLELELNIVSKLKNTFNVMKLDSESIPLNAL